jgi:hypothetical protein
MISTPGVKFPYHINSFPMAGTSVLALFWTMLAKEISEIHVSSPSTNFRTEAAPDDE